MVLSGNLNVATLLFIYLILHQSYERDMVDSCFVTTSSKTQLTVNFFKIKKQSNQNTSARTIAMQAV